MSLEQQANTKKELILLVVLQAAALLIVSFITLSTKAVQAHVPDIRLYYKAAHLLSQGQLPYQKSFPLEYPPGSLIAFYLPNLLALGQTLRLHPYAQLFLVGNALWNVLIALTLIRITTRHKWYLDSLGTQQSYTLFVIALSPLLAWRYDLFPAFLTLLAFALILEDRPFRSGLALGLSIAAKLYPIVLLPIFAAYLLTKRETRSFGKMLLGIGVATGIVLLPFVHRTPQALFSFLTYHQRRGLEIETLPAGLILLARQMGFLNASVIQNYGAEHLVSALATSVVQWLPWVFILLYGFVLVICLRRFQREYAVSQTVSKESLVIFIMAALVAFIVANKVFSAQYLIWLLPFAALLPALQTRLLLLISLLTMAVFPYFFAALLALNPAAILLLNARNALFIGFFMWILRDQAQSPGKVSFLPSLEK